MLKNSVDQYMKHTPTYHQVCRLLFLKQKTSRNERNCLHSHIDHAAIRYLTPKDYTHDFNEAGYKLQPETYQFPKFEAYSRWYLNKDLLIPRMFVSYYVGEFLPSIKSFDTYKNINKINPFVSWTTLFRGHINHLALRVDDIEMATETLIKSGIKMNEDGGLYKVSNDGLLIQTATLSEPYTYSFVNGQVENVGYTFVELVQRKCDKDGKMREGFESQNASRIFTSTAETLM
jgi:hypothetical protein